MVGRDQAIVNVLCQLHDDLLKLTAASDEIKTEDVYYMTVPEDGGRRSFTTGITKIDFKTGIILNPDGSIETLSRKLDLTQTHDVMHALSIHPNQEIKFRLDGLGQQTVYESYLFQLPYVTYTTLEIECTTSTDINLFACTHPQATLDYFKVTVVNILEQDSINGDTTESQSWDAVTTLKNNLNRIRKQIIDISGESWGTVTKSILDYFNITTGHDHDGVNSKKATAADILNVGSGNIVATDVQAAINELDSEKLANAHAANHITGGSDTIDNAIASGAAGLMTGSNLTKLDSITAGADVTADNAPKAHETSHKAAGSDEILLDEFGSPTDVTTLNTSTSQHGLCPKLDNNPNHHLNGQGSWTDIDADDVEPNLISCHNATGSSIAIRSVCYISGDQSGVPQITKAQADAAANASKMLVITTAAIANGAAGSCRVLGKVTGFTGLTAGAIQYLSDDTAGAIEESATTTATEIVRIIGYAISSTVIFFNPDKTYIENA